MYRKEDTVVVTGQLLTVCVSDRVPRSSSAYVVHWVFPSTLDTQQQPESLKRRWNISLLVIILVTWTNNGCHLRSEKTLSGLDFICIFDKRVFWWRYSSMSTSLQDILAFIRDLLVFPKYEELIWSSCVSGSRAGRLPIRRSVAWSPAASVYVLKCPWAGFWTRSCPRCIRRSVSERKCA